MSVLQVLHIPDERLRKVAKPVEEVNAEIQRIVDDMFETMYAEEGIGLAATQVDIHQRIIVIDVSFYNFFFFIYDYIYFINVKKIWFISSI